MSTTVIIGNGIAGISTAIQLRQLNNDPIIVISSETQHFFSRTALMYVYMGQLRYKDTKPYEDSFWEQQDLQLVFDKVLSVDTTSKSLKLESENVITYDHLVIACGSKPRRGNWTGDKLKGIQSLYSIQDLDKIEDLTKNISNAVVVGGGLIGIELCEMLASRNIDVDFLIREESFMRGFFNEDESKLIEGHIKKHGINLHVATEVDSFRGDQKRNLKSIVTNKGSTIPCSFAGVTIGVEPNIGFLMNSKIETSKGILVDQNLQTSISGIYAVGDCCEVRLPEAGRRSIEPVWYTGKLMGEIVAHNINGTDRKYAPGLWFNSAKFFDLEYQVYGWIPAKNADGHDDFLWQDHNNLQSLRIHYDKNSSAVTGFNFIGIRARHKVCESAIQNNITVAEFIDHLNDVIFDPEFSINPTNKIKNHFNNLQLITN